MVLAVLTRLRPATLAALTPVVLLLFLVTGSPPLRVLNLTGMRYNVRFGLVMPVPVPVPVPVPIAVRVAQVCRVRRGRWCWPIALVAALLVAAAAGTATGGTATLQEASVQDLGWAPRRVARS